MIFPLPSVPDHMLLILDGITSQQTDYSWAETTWDPGKGTFLSSSQLVQQTFWGRTKPSCQTGTKYLPTEYTEVPRRNKWTKDDKIQVWNIFLLKIHVQWSTWCRKRLLEESQKEIIPKQDMNINSKLKKNELPIKTTIRCPWDISIIYAADEIDLNTRQYLENLCKGS